MGNVEPKIVFCNVCNNTAAKDTVTEHLTRGGFCEHHGFEGDALHWYAKIDGRGMCYRTCVLCKKFVAMGVLCKHCEKQNAQNWYPD